MLIALIEDNPADAYWFRETLAQMDTGHDLLLFKTWAHAHEHFRTHPPPDLIVTDWIMPGFEFEFPEFLEGVRRIPEYESIPVAVCTGSADFYHKRELDHGTVGCLQKPVDPVQLSSVMSAIARSASV